MAGTLSLLFMIVCSVLGGVPDTRHTGDTLFIIYE